MQQLRGITYLKIVTIQKESKIQIDANNQWKEVKEKSNNPEKNSKKKAQNGKKISITFQMTDQKINMRKMKVAAKIAPPLLPA